MPEEWVSILDYLRDLRTRNLEKYNALPKARSPEEIANALGISVRRVRQHLAGMSRLGLIEKRTRGTNQSGFPCKSFYTYR